MSWKNGDKFYLPGMGGLRCDIHQALSVHCLKPSSLPDGERYHLRTMFSLGFPRLANGRTGQKLVRPERVAWFGVE